MKKYLLFALLLIVLNGETLQCMLLKTVVSNKSLLPKFSNKKSNYLKKYSSKYSTSKDNANDHEALKKVLDLNEVLEKKYLPQTKFLRKVFVGCVLSPAVVAITAIIPGFLDCNDTLFLSGALGLSYTVPLCKIGLYGFPATILAEWAINSEVKSNHVIIKEITEKQNMKTPKLD